MKAAAASADLRIAWCGIALLGLACYAVVVAPGERRTAVLRSRAFELTELVARNERLTQSLGALTRVRKRVEADLRALKGQNTSGKAAVAALEVLREDASAHDVIVSGVAPGEIEASESKSGSQDVTIVLQGRYRNVLQVIAELPRRNVLIDIRDVALARAADAGPSLFPGVEARLHATLYHDISALMKEDWHATPAPQ